ncbi:MAG: hypothetical protein ACI9XO_004697 [Paraglaciecola sp.]|jgi:hypothetical protein
MKTKAEKIAEARKHSEAEKAKKKAVRDGKSNTTETGKMGKKGKSLIPQSKGKN